MFRVCGRTIQVSAGDTGVIRFTAEGVKLTQADRVVFTVRRADGEAVIQKVIMPEEDELRIPFVHEDTENLRPGAYEWDVRYVMDAQMDERGAVTGGREVITPFLPSQLYVMKVVGNV